MASTFHSKVLIERKVPVPMRDGVKLSADIYRPRGVDVPLPVLLMRLPYGRAIASTVTYAHPSWYALQGYIIVIQDVRGCGTSEGEFYPFRYEYEDGYDTVQWCAEVLTGTTGQVGMYGFSYQGVTQFQAAVMQPPGLVTICPAMATGDFYHGWFYFGGALALDFTLSWALQLTHNRAYFCKLEPLATQLLQAQGNISDWLHSLPLNQLEILKQEPLGQFFFDWIEHAQADDPYWQDLNPVSRFTSFDLPALHIAGWADLFIEATINTYEQAKLATSSLQKLVIGPWQHMPWRSQVGELDFGEAAVPHIDQLQIDWFDCWLKGKDNGIRQEPAVTAFLMGQNRWLSLTELGISVNLPVNSHAHPPVIPDVKLAYLYLYPNGQLKAEPSTALNTLESIPDIYIYDPRLPNPSTPYGAYDQRPIHQRWDVLIYNNAVLTEDMSILGIPTFYLYAATSVPDTDWVIKLLDIFPDGRQMLVTMGVLRARFRTSWIEPEFIASEAVLEYRIALRPTGHCFLTGHRIGIAIASAAFPLIERHSNTTKLPCTAITSDFTEATQQIYHSWEFPSHLRLPLLNENSK